MMLLRDPIVHGAAPPHKCLWPGSFSRAAEPARSIKPILGYGVISPASSQQGYHSQSSSCKPFGFIPQHNVLPLSLPPTQYSHLQTAPAPRWAVPRRRRRQHNTLTLTTLTPASDSDHWKCQAVVSFADDINKSPYVECRGLYGLPLQLSAEWPPSHKRCHPLLR